MTYRTTAQVMKDESGRPFIIVREYVRTETLELEWRQEIDADQLCSQGRKKRQHGNEAVKSHILAARTVANIVKTSLVWWFPP